MGHQCYTSAQTMEYSRSIQTGGTVWIMTHLLQQTKRRKILYREVVVGRQAMFHVKRRKKEKMLKCPVFKNRSQAPIWYNKMLARVESDRIVESWSFSILVRCPSCWCGLVLLEDLSWPFFFCSYRNFQVNFKVNI